MYRSLSTMFCFHYLTVIRRDSSVSSSVHNNESINKLLYIYWSSLFLLCSAASWIFFFCVGRYFFSILPCFHLYFPGIHSTVSLCLCRRRKATFWSVLYLPFFLYPVCVFFWLRTNLRSSLPVLFTLAYFPHVKFKYLLFLFSSGWARPHVSYFHILTLWFPVFYIHRLYTHLYHVLFFYYHPL